MLSKKQLNFIILGLILLFSFGYFSKSTAETIPSTNIDTYTINLSGSELNNVSGLNIKVTIPGKDADIKTGITFKATGASVLLSTVTGPSSEEYTISLVLNGMITDGKATITGKFEDNSIISGAQFLVTQITRDGGADITNLLTTKEVTFSNSKVTPTPLPTATPSTTATPSPGATTNPTPSSVSAETQSVIDLITAENGELEVDPSDIQEALANKDEARLTVSANDTFQLKKGGLNRFYLRLSGSIDKGYINDNNLDQLACYVIPYDKSGEYAVLPIDFLKIANPIFSVPIKNNGSKYRFTKRAAVNLIPDGKGLQLLKNEISSLEFTLESACLLFNKKKEESALSSYASSKGKLISNLTLADYIDYFSRSSFQGVNIINSKIQDITIFAPKTADVNK